MVNTDKTTLFFSKNTDVHVEEAIKNSLGVPAIHHYEKYLGLPSFIGRNKKACFTQIKERIWAKMQGWKEKLLSQAGKEIMIKAVVQSIPTYSMSVFKLPVGLCKDIEAMIRKFWWGQGENRKLHWINWSTLCDSKSVGGLGFRDIQRFNNAMLAKQVWRLFHQRDTLLFRVFSAKYFPNGNIFDAPIHPKCSYAWKSILQAREVIQHGAVWRVGNGHLIDIWNHRWLSEHTPGLVMSPRLDVNLNKVSDLLLHNPKQWNTDLLDRVFYPWEANEIKRIYLSEDTVEDKLIWPLTPSGVYSVKSAYHMLSSAVLQSKASSSSSEGAKEVWTGIWRIRAPNRVRHSNEDESVPTTCTGRCSLPSL